MFPTKNLFGTFLKVCRRLFYRSCLIKQLSKGSQTPASYFYVDFPDREVFAWCKTKYNLYPFVPSRF